MGLWHFQSSLNKGELDPRLAGRIDLAAYYNGLKTATNVLALPQGGMTKRAGMEYIATATANGRLEPFSFNTEQNYLLAFSNLQVKVFKDDVLQATVVTPWTLAQLADIDYIQSADTAIVVHPDVAPYAISRTSHTAWTVAAISLSNIPQFDFNDASSPTPVAEVQRINFSAHNYGDRYKISLNGVLTEEIVFASNNTANHNDIADALQALINTGNTGISVTTQTSLDTYNVTLAGDSADNWDEMTVTGVSTKSTSFEATTTTITGGTTRKEDVWSATRGWPRTATFHEGRLWFGGSSSLPAALWGSRVNDFFNFDEGRARDDELIFASLDTDQVNAIEGIFSNRTLQVFTSGGEFYVPESPITPANVGVKPQSNIGSKRVRPVTIDGVTLFVQRTGKALIQYVFINEFQANQSKPVSTLAPHLMKDPIQMQVSRGTEASDANYVYLVNADGTVTVFNTLSGEDVQAFTAWTTSGDIKSLAVVDDRVYQLVEREINSSTVYYIEKENPLLNTDAATIGTGLASDTLTGLGHLEGETVRVKADGTVQEDEVVVSGQITIGKTADTIEAGLNFQPIIETMPVTMKIPNVGDIAAKKKKLTRVALHLYESNAVKVNGELLPDRTIGQDIFEAPTPQTGLKRLRLAGWSTEASVIITQEEPMPLTVLSIGIEVSI